MFLVCNYSLMAMALIVERTAGQASSGTHLASLEDHLDTIADLLTIPQRLERVAETARMPAQPRPQYVASAKGLEAQCGQRKARQGGLA